MGEAGSQSQVPAYQLRNLRGEDVPAAAALWFRVFQHTQDPPPVEFVRYFREVFCHNPWKQDDLPSYVCVDAAGAVVGFLGIIPRRMLFRGQPIRVAVATAFAVEPRKGLGFAAIDLLKRLYAGPQDLTYSDGARDTAAQLCQALGGEVPRLFCLEWRRIFRPVQYTAGLLASRKRLRPLLWACRPFAALADRILGCSGRFRTPRPRGAAAAATPEEIVTCWKSLPKKQALLPDYEPHSISWLLKMAAARQGQGRLCQMVVKNESGRPVGWYVYYLQKGGLSRLLQLGAAARELNRVLDHLFHHARQNGSAAIDGILDPLCLTELDSRHCRFRCLGTGVVIQSRNKELLQAIHRGDAALSRLDGEWWFGFGHKPADEEA